MWKKRDETQMLPWFIESYFGLLHHRTHFEIETTSWSRKSWYKQRYSGGILTWRMFHSRSRSRHQIAWGHSTARVPHATTRNRHAAARIWHATTRVPHATARIPHAAARVPHATTRIPHATTRVPHTTTWTNSRWSRMLIFVVCTTFDRTCGFGDSSNGTLHTIRLTRFRLQYKAWPENKNKKSFGGTLTTIYCTFLDINSLF